MFYYNIIYYPVLKQYQFSLKSCGIFTTFFILKKTFQYNFDSPNYKVKRCIVKLVDGRNREPLN